LEELADVQVTSVSKRWEPLAAAPSSIFVISGADIARSAATSLPEALRLAPNLQVAQAGAGRYVITARGFNGAPSAQNFSNKLLVLIDGRSVYTPLYSGVYWDMQDVLLQDIERIEVISGPGATLWGANAVNGVINIITRASGDTQGGLVDLAAGLEGQHLGVRYGGALAEGLTYRLYAKSAYVRNTTRADGRSANDHWSKPQAGIRLDWAASARDEVTLQGDIFDGFVAQSGGPAESLKGRNLTARWTRTLSPDSSLQVQAFYDRAARGAPVDGSGFGVSTYDLDVQHGWRWGRHELVWGGGYRNVRYRIDGSSSLQFSPAAGRFHLWNAFVQDTIAIGDDFQAVVGLKLEDDAYVGAEVLPNVRLAWTPSEDLTLWTAVSRAVRSPTPFDRDVVEILGGRPFLVGGKDFVSEKLTAYELGAKLRPSDRVSFSISAFYNDYDDLRSIEVTPVTFLPLRWGNGMDGHTYGVEAWGEVRMSRWWRLAGSLNYLDQSFRFKSGASGLLGPSQAANDAKYRASLSSSMDLPGGFSLDGVLRYVSALPDPRVPAYTELDARLGWRVADRVTIAVAGRNLLHEDHIEYTDGNLIPRSLFVELQWRF
jgi:iron complex outermembrane receptor protein